MTSGVYKRTKPGGMTGKIPWNKGKKGLQSGWAKGTKGILKANSGSFKKGMIPKNKGTKGIMKSNSTSFKKGSVPHNKDKKGIYKHTDEAKAKISLNGFHYGMLGKKQSVESRKKSSNSHKGEKSHLWKGGVTSINMKIRAGIEYRLWREAVFERDNYTCIWCETRSGNGKAIILHADHIKPFAQYPELRFALDNGRTLCIDCHKKTETYGSKFRKYSKSIR